MTIVIIFLHKIIKIVLQILNYFRYNVALYYCLKLIGKWLINWEK